MRETVDIGKIVELGVGVVNRLMSFSRWMQANCKRALNSTAQLVTQRKNAKPVKEKREVIDEAERLCVPFECS